VNQLIDTTKPSTQMEISEEEYLAATSYIRLLLTKKPMPPINPTYLQICQWVVELAARGDIFVKINFRREESDETD